MTLGDSGDMAIRVTNEHREVCAFLLKTLLDTAPSGDPVVWVDLGCGEGDVLAVIRAGIPDDLRRRMWYVGCDASDVTRARAQVASSGLDGRSQCIEGDLTSETTFRSIVQATGDVSMVTLTNVIHEIRPPSALPSVLARALLLLKPDGYLVAYDMERLSAGDIWDETEAVTWAFDEIEGMVQMFCRALGVTDGSTVVHWKHHSTTGWTLLMRGSVLHGGTGVGSWPERAVVAAEQAVVSAVRDKRTHRMEDIGLVLRRLSGLDAETPETRKRVFQALETEFPSLVRDYFASVIASGGDWATGWAALFPSAGEGRSRAQGTSDQGGEERGYKCPESRH
jgi:SAM-dependent methyltransferase